MMRTSFKVTDYATYRGNSIAAIKALCALGGMTLKEANIGSDAMIAGETFTFESTNDSPTIKYLADLGVEIVGQETGEYVAAARELAILSISQGKYGKATTILFALLVIDPFAR